MEITFLVADNLRDTIKVNFERAKIIVSDFLDSVISPSLFYATAEDNYKPHFVGKFSDKTEAMIEMILISKSLGVNPKELVPNETMNSFFAFSDKGYDLDVNFYIGRVSWCRRQVKEMREWRKLMKDAFGEDK